MPKKKKSVKRSPKNRSKKMPSLKVSEKVDDLWPAPSRTVLHRPDRMKYVRKQIQEVGCVFCLSCKVGPSLESLCVYKTKHSMVILNKYPYNSGHVLVLPKRHVGDLQKLSVPEWRDLMDLVRLTQKVVGKVYEPTGMNLGVNHGATGGAGIPEHLHFHLIPRWAGDLNFFPLIAETKVVIETLEASYLRLQKAFKK